MKQSALMRLWRHRWLDQGDARRAVPPALAERLRRRVAASEGRHTGEVRICVEGALPMSYLWRHWRDRAPIEQILRERALMQFAKLGVWDTTERNGVLIYLNLAEHAIELVADRGLSAHVSPAEWAAMVQHLGEALRAGRVEDGLTGALEEVSAALVRHYPAPQAADGARPNQLPDTVTLC